MRINLFFKIIKIYPGIAIILTSVLFALGSYWLKTSPTIANMANKEEIVYLNAPSNVIIGEGIKIEKKDGDRWLSEELYNYRFIISGQKRFNVAIDIIANNKCEIYIKLFEDKETISFVVSTKHAMCFFDYCQKYAK